MELWIKFCVYAPIVWGLAIGMVLRLYFGGIRGFSVSTPEGCPLGLILANWFTYTAIIQ